MSESTLAVVLDSCAKRFHGLKDLGDRALAQINDTHIHATPHPECNSIAVQIQHLHGNMLSRWVNFLTEDGEKNSRDRDGEFEEDFTLDKAELLGMWEEGWKAVFDALSAMTPSDLPRVVTIRQQPLTAIDAIHRQLTHYGYHVGQIVFLARMLVGSSWKTLSIPRGGSRAYKPRQND